MSIFVTALCSLYLFMGSVMADGGVQAADQTENLNSYWRQNDTVVLLCEYESRWIPPTKEMPKGQIQSTGRVIDIVKGDQGLIGQKIACRRLVEDPPFWLREGQLAGIPQVRYFFTNSAQLTLHSDFLGGNIDSLPGFGVNDSSFAPLFRKMLEGDLLKGRVQSTIAETISRLQHSETGKKYDTVLLLCEYAKSWQCASEGERGQASLTTHAIVVRVVKGEANVEDILCFTSKGELPEWLPLSGRVSLDGRLSLFFTDNENMNRSGSTITVEDESACYSFPLENVPQRDIRLKEMVYRKE